MKTNLERQKVEGASHKGSAGPKNSKVEEFLYDYQKASAESSFLSPSYEAPRGFEEYAHPQVDGPTAPSALTAQNTLITTNLGPSNLLNSQNNTAKLMNPLKGKELKSYNDMKLYFQI